MSYDTERGLAMAGTGAATGAALGGVPGALIGGAVGAGMGFIPGKKGPNYGNVKEQFEARNRQIAGFAAQLGQARARYMSSLNTMYNNAYARFSGNAEAGFASRGLSVSGGAFASTLAKESARMTDEGNVMAAGMEREDLRSVDSAYGQNSGMYMGAIAPGAGMAFQADREDMRAMGGFAGKLATMKYGNMLENSNDGKPLGRAGINRPGSTKDTQMGPSWNGWGQDY